jgi:hypothetical protein
VPAVPSMIMPWIMLAGQGAGMVKQLLGTLWSCMRPGFRTPTEVSLVRTQPPDSCIIVASITRLSTPVDAETELMAARVSSFSASVVGAVPESAQDRLPMTPTFLDQRSSNDNHWSIVGQPMPPSPLYVCLATGPPDWRRAVWIGALEGVDFEGADVGGSAVDNSDVEDSTVDI